MISTTAEDCATEATDFSRLIRSDRVHGTLYTDPKIYEDELRKIWYRIWLYVGHVSEVPRANDFLVKPMGPEEVIMTRDGEGQVHLLLNRCPHRGNRVCNAQEGNAKSFTCNFHGWTFNVDGSLRGYPFPSGYAEDKRKSLGLARVPRMEIYRGFVFASFASHGESLEAQLGGARYALDALCDTSPEGEVELTAGFLKHKVDANWKLVVENETDGYHPAFTHASIFEVADSKIGTLYSSESSALTRYFGNGHSEVDLRPEFRKRNEPMSWFGTSADRLPAYTSKMEAAYGVERARAIMVDGTPHIMIFPNLFIAEIQLFTLQPVSVGETVQHVTALQFKGAPDLNRRMRQQTMGSVGPAGFLLADDAEMYERSQLGLQQSLPEWVYLGRGTHRESRDENGFMTGHSTDEVPSRGMWQYYRELMEVK